MAILFTAYLLHITKSGASEAASCGARIGAVRRRRSHVNAALVYSIRLCSTQNAAS